MYFVVSFLSFWIYIFNTSIHGFPLSGITGWNFFEEIQAETPIVNYQNANFKVITNGLRETEYPVLSQNLYTYLFGLAYNIDTDGRIPYLYTNNEFRRHLESNTEWFLSTYMIFSDILQEKSSKSYETYIELARRSKVYEIKLSEQVYKESNVYTLTEEFKLKVNQLIEMENEMIQEQHIEDLIRTFGTHFFRTVKVGDITMTHRNSPFFIRKNAVIGGDITPLSHAMFLMEWNCNCLGSSKSNKCNKICFLKDKFNEVMFRKKDEKREAIYRQRPCLLTCSFRAGGYCSQDGVCKESDLQHDFLLQLIKKHTKSVLSGETPPEHDLFGIYGYDNPLDTHNLLTSLFNWCIFYSSSSFTSLFKIIQSLPRHIDWVEYLFMKDPRDRYYNEFESNRFNVYRLMEENLTFSDSLLSRSNISLIAEYYLLTIGDLTYGTVKQKVFEISTIVAWNDYLEQKVSIPDLIQMMHKSLEYLLPKGNSDNWHNKYLSNTDDALNLDHFRYLVLDSYLKSLVPTSIDIQVTDDNQSKKKKIPQAIPFCTEDDCLTFCPVQNIKAYDWFDEIDSKSSLQAKKACETCFNHCEKNLLWVYGPGKKSFLQLSLWSAYGKVEGLSFVFGVNSYPSSSLSYEGGTYLIHAFNKNGIHYSLQRFHGWWYSPSVTKDLSVELSICTFDGPLNSRKQVEATSKISCPSSCTTGKTTYLWNFAVKDPDNRLQAKTACEACFGSCFKRSINHLGITFLVWRSNSATAPFYFVYKSYIFKEENSLPYSGSVRYYDTENDKYHKGELFGYWRDRNVEEQNLQLHTYGE